MAAWRSLVVQGLSMALMVSGASMILAAGAYVVYAKAAEAQLASLNQIAEPVVTAPAPEDGWIAWAVPAGPQDGWTAWATDGAALEPVEQVAVPFVSRVPFPPAQQVQIPRLEIDSHIVELGTKVQDGQLVWETPKWAVGHHKGTANPGEIGNAVFSGHISSPLSNEGNVFQRLPEIQLGDEIIVTSDLGTFFYRVTETKVVTPDRIDVMDPTPEPVITLITCVPDWVYSHRLIVTAKPYRWEYAAPGTLPAS
ncbi:MAG: class D sortase [Chloroflexi bacterium]|nr:class D sortase [Chloroflexota bacterium]